ncbi:hypothetical protein MNV84_01789 [Leishmania braziliensis]|nr:hypothetical protein MNV84_01789 [Leishmania braziliensis]
MSRWALFSSDNDDDVDDVVSVAGAGAGDRAMSGALGPLLALDPVSTGRASQLYSSSVDRDRMNTAAVQLPESSKVTATRRNLSQLFGAGPTPLTTPAEANFPSQPSAMENTAARNLANGAAVVTGSGATEITAFFAPRFDYEGSSSTGAASDVAAAVVAATGEAAAGLITAEHAVVQAYRDSLYSGTCILALCVPSAPTSVVTTSAASPPSVALRRHLLREKQGAGAASNVAACGPTLLLVSSNRQVLCRVALDATDGVFASDSLQLRQDAAQPQYLTFFDAGCTGARRKSSSQRSAGGGGSSRCWWTCMFPNRDKASRFLVSIYTVAQYAAVLANREGTTSAPVSSVRTLPAPPLSKTDKAEAAAMGGAPDVVRPDVPATICWQTWALCRVSQQSLYCLPGSCIESVLPSTPRAVAATDGTLWDAAAAALVGMQAGESRLVFLTPEETRTRQPTSRADSHRSDRPGRGALQRPLDTPAVMYMTCLEVTSSPIGTPRPSTPAAASDLAPLLPHPTPPAPATATAGEQPPLAAAPSQVPGTANAQSTDVLLQQLLLHLLQQQPHEPLPNAHTSHQGPSHGWGDMERALTRVQVQLGSLYEKIDRLDIEAKLQHNNTELERVMRRVVGLAPQEEVAVEDSLKDREKLLASIELYRHKYEEANASYQRALEAMGRSSDRAQTLEKDLHLQQDLWAQQRKEEAEQMRLRLVERDARHREELERVSMERYAAGRSDGHAAGYREGRQATLLEVEDSGANGGGGSVVAQWRAKLMAQSQEVIALQTALQDAKLRHERDRRQLRAEIDVLSELNEKLQHLQVNADVRVPEETAQQQCKRVKRTLNAVYSQVEGQLLQLSSLQRRARAGDPQSSRTVDEGAYVEGAREAWSTNGSGGGDLVAMDDVLAIIMEAIRSEAQTVVAQIRSDEAQRTTKNAELRALTVARRSGQQPSPASSHGYPPSASSALLVRYGMEEEVRGPWVEHSTAEKHASTTPPPPPLPPVHTTASQDALAAVAAALLPKVAQAASMKVSAAEAAEVTYRGDGRVCEDTAVNQATVSPVTVEEPLCSEKGATGGGGENGDADPVARQSCNAPTRTDLDATAASSAVSSSAYERRVEFADVGDGEALRSNVADNTDGHHAFSSSVLAAADDAAAAWAPGGLCSSPGIAEKAQPVPTSHPTVATTATTSSAPTWVGADSPCMMHRAHDTLEEVRAVDIASAHTSRHSGTSLSSSSSSSTPAKSSRMATRLSGDARASPPPPPFVPPPGNEDDDGGRHGGEAIGDSPSGSMTAPGCTHEPWTGSP